MTIEQIKEILNTNTYDFLRNDKHLGNNIILLGLGGSYAYGTSNENSDIDCRGVALNQKEEILTSQNFEQFVDEKTDTTIYSFNKFISLLTNVNPNTIELLGLKPEHYIYISPIGKELLDKKQIFLSKKAIHSFAGYANQQLYRLNQRSAHKLSQSELEKHILNTLENMKYDFVTKYASFSEDNIHLYIDKAVQKG
ncbi:MAG: nucleotidyltransferase domain-containing protein, partial [Lachnospiraceae bacterium]|nr:nucleotidyltransferase domain-containing protein [Lachnospiraceae bacterium]